MPRERLRKRPKKTLGLHCGWTFAQTAYNNHKNKNKLTVAITEKESLISRVTTLLKSNVQCSTPTEILEVIQRNRKAWSVQMKQINQQKHPGGKNLMADIGDKAYKTPVLKMLQELKEDVQKI